MPLVDPVVEELTLPVETVDWVAAPVGTVGDISTLVTDTVVGDTCNTGGGMAPIGSESVVVTSLPSVSVVTDTANFIEAVDCKTMLPNYSSPV